MKLSIVFSLCALTTASASVVTSALQPPIEIPSSRFKTELVFDAPLLPIKPTLAGILHFMSIIARSDLDKVLEPRTYSTPPYPEVVITTHSTSTARFLIWGAYLAAADMIKYTRFNDVVINLFWDKVVVGQISILVDTRMGLLSTTHNNTGGVVTDGRELNLEEIDNGTTRTHMESLNLPLAGNVTRTAATIKNASAVSSSKVGRTVSDNQSTSPTQIPPDAPLTSRFAIDFDRVPHASKLPRNDVFLAFYAAMLDIAKYPAGNQLGYFNNNSPTAHMRVNMYEAGVGCLVILPTLLTTISSKNMMR